MLRWKSVLADALTKGRLAKGARRKNRNASEHTRRMRLEALEDRRMLAVDVFVDPATGLVTIKDASGLAEGSNVEEDNVVSVMAANVDPDGAGGAAAQDVLIVEDLSGINAIGIGIFQSSPTQVIVPQNFDADPGAGVVLADVLTATIVVDLQGGDDDLVFDSSADTIPVVTDYDLRGGDNGTQSDQLLLSGTVGVTESLTIQPSNNNDSPDRAMIVGYAGVTITSRGYENIQYVGSNGDDDLIVNLGAGVATTRVQNDVIGNTDEVLSDVLPKISFTQIQDFTLQASIDPTAATFVLDDLGGADSYLFESVLSDTLIIEGRGAADAITASIDAGGNLQVAGSGAIISTTGMNLSDELIVNTLSGDDTLTVDLDGTALIRTPIHYDGGTGSDRLNTTGTPTATIQIASYTPGLQPDEGRLTYDQNVLEAGVDMTVDFDNLEPVIDLLAAASLVVNGNGDGNQITYSTGSIAARGLVSIDGFETIEFENKASLALQGLGGDDTIVANNGLLPTGLTLLGALGGDGNDTIRLESLPDASATTFIGVASAAGEGGDDIIDGSGINVATPLALVGGAGNDTITGGAGVDTIVGGAGDDTFVDSPGSDNYDGGTGNNTLLFRGTINNDVIDVTQTAPTTVTFSDDLTPATFTTETLTLGTIQQLRIEALDGDDLIRVAHADAFSDNDLVSVPPGQSIRFEVQGNSPNASDRLVVQDLGLGDLVIHRVGADQRSGSVTVGGAPNTLAPVDYSGVESIDVTPLSANFLGATGADGLGQLVVFKNDPHEANNSIATATFLGSGATLNVDPTIDPGGIPAFGVPGDSDFYRFVAEKTGTLDLQVYFEEIPTLANGRPGLPNNGDLDIQLYDSTGALVAGAGPTFGGNNGGGTNPELNVDGDAAFEDERIRVPVVEGETYYLRVFGNVNAAGVGAINVYNITAINEAPPVPFDLELNDILQIGAVNNGVVPTATVFRANVAPANGVLPPPALDYVGKTVEFTSGVNIGRSAVITAFNNGTGQFTVGAGLVAAPAAGDMFLIETTDTGRSQFDNTTRDNTPIVTFGLNDNILLNDLPGNPAAALPPDEIIPIPFNPSQAAALAAGAGFRVPVFIEGAPQQPAQPPLTPVGYAVPLAGVPGVYRFDFGTDAIGGALALADGSHYVSAGVEIIDPATAAQFGYGPRSQSLEIVVDTTIPLISFGDPTIAFDGLHPDSDSGVVPTFQTLTDRVTNDSTPMFFGQAEANSIVKAYVDVDASGTLTAADVFIGQTVATPLDGTNQEPFGSWELTSTVDLNDGNFNVQDGPRTILATAEDVAGNVSRAAVALAIFLDTQGPQVAAVSANAQPDTGGGSYDLFDPKPSVNGPSPLINSITINFVDLPARSDVAGTINDFLYPAFDTAIASNVGNYSVVGDAVGQVGIVSAVVDQAVKLSGTLSAVTNATNFTDGALVGAAIVPAVGDFITFNNGATAGLWQRITNFNAATGAITVDLAAGAGPAVGDGYSIITAASLSHAIFPSFNTTAQETVTGAMSNMTFLAGNIGGGIAPTVGDYIRFNTGPASSGNLGNPVIRRVTAFNAGTGQITLNSALPAAPMVGDGFSLIGGVNSVPLNFHLAPVAFANTASVTLTFAAPLPDDRFTLTVSDNLG